MRVIITVDPDGTTRADAIDLIGDSWREYLSYLSLAKGCREANDMLSQNSAIRSALINLFSHLDGVVSGLWQKLCKSSKTFKPSVKDERRCTIKMKISDLRRHAVREYNKALPELTLQRNLLRDILAHPSVSKQSEGDDLLPHPEDLNIPNISVREVEDAGKIVDDWLNQLCAIYGITRMHDKESICREWEGSPEQS